MTLLKRLYVTAIVAAIGCGGAASNDINGANGGDGGGLDGTLGDGTTGTDGQASNDGAPGDAAKPTGTIPCGNQAPCDSATQECCLGAPRDGGGTGAVCVAKGTCTTGSALSCSSAANCSGGICCGTLTQKEGGFGFDVNASCQSTCSGAGEVQLCQQNTECTSGECRDTFGNIKTCRQRFGGDGGFPQDAAGGG